MLVHKNPRTNVTRIGTYMKDQILKRTNCLKRELILDDFSKEDPLSTLEMSLSKLKKHLK